VARGLIEFCDGGPPVYNYISLAGPHAGISSVPMCGVSFFYKSFFSKYFFYDFNLINQSQ